MNKIVPIEPTEEMKDNARSFLLGLELGIKSFELMQEHLRMSGAFIPSWFAESKGHLNKMAKAHYIFEAMLEAAPESDHIIVSKAEYEQMLEALEKYGRHLADCLFLPNWIDHKCNCGLFKVLEKAKEKL